METLHVVVNTRMPFISFNRHYHTNATPQPIELLYNCLLFMLSNKGRQRWSTPVLPNEGEGGLK